MRLMTLKDILPFVIVNAVCTHANLHLEIDEWLVGFIRAPDFQEVTSGLRY